MATVKRKKGTTDHGKSRRTRECPCGCGCEDKCDVQRRDELEEHYEYSLRDSVRRMQMLSLSEALSLLEQHGEDNPMVEHIVELLTGAFKDDLKLYANHE
jgi:hypothetical protein